AQRVGALAGSNSGTVTNAYATGSVTGGNYDFPGVSKVGGLVGVNDGTITNAHATDNVSGQSKVGGLVGYNEGTITNAHATGNVSGQSKVGGLVGANGGLTVFNGDPLVSYGGPISNSYATGNVSGQSKVGGLVGYNYSDGIRDVYATGNVSGTGDNVGGFVGYNQYGSITNAHATGNVSGNTCVGGFAGYNDGTITSAYATGNASGQSMVGGFVGDNDYGSITNAFATGNVSGSADNVGGFVGYNVYANISNAYATGSVSGNDYIGGFVGYSSSYGLNNVYATGNVSGTGGRVGGFVGYHDDFIGTITNAYASGTLNGTVAPNTANRPAYLAYFAGVTENADDITNFTSDAVITSVNSALFTSVTFTGGEEGTGSDWFTAANWSGRYVPSVMDTVTLNENVSINGVAMAYRVNTSGSLEHNTAGVSISFDDPTVSSLAIGSASPSLGSSAHPVSINYGDSGKLNLTNQTSNAETGYVTFNYNDTPYEVIQNTSQLTNLSDTSVGHNVVIGLDLNLNGQTFTPIDNLIQARSLMA
ncbi:MAG: hypothetical protein EBQ59_00670, partial [Verrucomicrobia bacterium]|nr:hypothetical protein [Verrucomicrobiota bacterium]